MLASSAHRLLLLCQFKGLYQTAANLYADAFAADPKLPEDLNSQVRYNAAWSDVEALLKRAKDST